MSDLYINEPSSKITADYHRAINLENMATKGGSWSKPHSSFKMVMIGETGSGKTSFLQLLLNYEKQFGREDFTLDLVSSFVKSDVARPPKEVWESDTTESNKYIAKYGDFTLEVIDTPGFGDTRGTDQQVQNIANIIAIVKKEKYINCVCLIINGTQVRLTEAMQNILKKIVSILPSSVVRNIIVIYTFTRDRFSLKFEPKMLQEFQLFIPTKHQFKIDNSYSRYYESCKKKPDKKELRMLRRDFEGNNETLDDIFEVIKSFKQVRTLKFGEFQEAVNNIRTCFNRLKVHYKNKDQITKLIDDVGSYESHVKEKAYTETTVTKDSEEKNLVCSKCNHNCHVPCDCWLTIFSVWFCSTIKDGKCVHCDHSYKDHSIGRIYYEKVSKTIILPDKDRTARRKKFEAVLSKYNDDIEKNSQLLESKIAKFQSVGSNFLFSKNATDQIDILIEELQETLPTFKDKDKILQILMDTKEVIRDPTTARNREIKARWACGVLGLDPDNVNKAEINQFFRQQAHQVHPDSTGDEFTATAFKHLNYAKDFLKRTFFGNS